MERYKVEPYRDSKEQGEYLIQGDDGVRIQAQKALLCRLCPASCLDRVRDYEPDHDILFPGVSQDVRQEMDHLHWWMVDQTSDEYGETDILSFCAFGAHEG